MIYNSNGEANVPHNLILTNKYNSTLGKVFANNLYANVNLPKRKVSKITEPGRSTCDLLTDLLEVAFRLGIELAKTCTPIFAIKMQQIIVWIKKKKLNKLIKTIKTPTSSRTTLTNNEMKNIIKVM